MKDRKDPRGRQMSSVLWLFPLGLLSNRSNVGVQVRRAPLEAALWSVNISGPSRSQVTSRNLCLSSPPSCQDPVAQDADLNQT